MCVHVCLYVCVERVQRGVGGGEILQVIVKFEFESTLRAIPMKRSLCD